MTEEEALKKWCPKMQVAAVVVPQGPGLTGRGPQFGIQLITNRVPPQQSGFCLGSACMAWRWEFKTEEEGKLGYCGLAGDR